jgi:predicted nuclease of predicted toxin-antitoxin system
MQSLTDPRSLDESLSKQSNNLVSNYDFGELLFVETVPHCGLVRLPDVPASKRIELMAQVLARYEQELAAGAIITVRGGRIRISKSVQ